MSSAARIRVELEDVDTPKEVLVGAFAQIAAKRRYGMEPIRDGDPEPVLFGVFIELNGPRPSGETDTATGAAFDAWLRTVAGFELVQPPGDDDGADPPPAESSGSSLGSPPTSE